MLVVGCCVVCGCVVLRCVLFNVGVVVRVVVCRLLRVAYCLLIGVC